MVSESLTLVEVFPREEGEQWRVFAPSSEFPAPWWEQELWVNRGEHWLSIQRDGIEVVRCKFHLTGGQLSRKMLGSMPTGQLDILAFEVALSARRQGVGRAALRAIRDMYPEPRLTALNDDATSRRFWDGVGWVRHQPTSPVLAGVERVTYSEV
ncbi:hypothetical protein [Microterricola viridarii]|uniref:hypothetical protein n=1 Tax=Microterricola viridarii TaxID=412690 RepID=UPI0012E9972C|nr:hypothetical protein [Microterricola viridarii]